MENLAPGLTAEIPQLGSCPSGLPREVVSVKVLLGHAQVAFLDPREVVSVKVLLGHAQVAFLERWSL